MLKLEAQPGAKFTPAQQKVKANGTSGAPTSPRTPRRATARPLAIKQRDRPCRSLAHTTRSAGARPATFEGETISKDVAVNAEVRTPDGQTTNKTADDYDFREGAGGGREGRPIITKISGLW